MRERLIRDWSKILIILLSGVRCTVGDERLAVNADKSRYSYARALPCALGKMISFQRLPELIDPHWLHLIVCQPQPSGNNEIMPTYFYSQTHLQFQSQIFATEFWYPHWADSNIGWRRWGQHHPESVAFPAALFAAATQLLSGSFVLTSEMKKEAVWIHWI